MNAIKELYKLCGSDDISITVLREKISQLSISADDVTRETYNKHPFLHSVCMNEKVTLEMVECVTDSFPGVVSWQTDVFDDSIIRGAKTASFALHCACYNQYCPTSVIKLLFKEHTSGIDCLTRIFNGVHEWGVKGIPLHYYLVPSMLLYIVHV